MLVGRVAAIWRYPVKSFMGEQLERVSVLPEGLDGDRRLAVRDAETGRILSAKGWDRLLEATARARNGGVEVAVPGQVPVQAGSADLDASLSAWLGRRVSLVGLPPIGERPVIDVDGGTFRGSPGRFFDSGPIHLVTTATLAHLRALAPGADFDPRRFRPNLVIETTAEGPVEQGWLGSALVIGQVRLEVMRPCRRCVMTTAPQQDLPRRPEILQTVAREAGNKTGVYCRTIRPGEIRVEDSVRLEP